MALKKEKKVELISSYTEALQNSQSAVYVKFAGLSVKDTEALRNALRSEGMNYAVVKKTLWSIAANKVGIKGEAPEVLTEMGVAYGNDPLAPARIAYEFSKSHKDKVAILGGIWEGEFRDKNMMTQLATIPPREVLLAQLAFVLKAPIQKLAIGINEVAKTKNA